MNLIKLSPLFVLAFLGINSIFVVHQTQQAIVLQFGELKTVHLEPGLKFKVPFVQDVIYYDSRVLSYDLPPVSVITNEQKPLVLDAYVRYKIKDPVSFFKSVKPSTESAARDRLKNLLESALKNVIGKITLPTLLSKERADVMKQIQLEVNAQTEKLGLEIIDVRIIRAELPEKNRDAVFGRMNAELAQFAKENRAKGEESAQGIRAKSDTEKATILAQAEVESRTIRGEADAEAIKITNEAFSKDPELYDVIKTLEAYEKTFNSDTNVVLSTGSDFLSLMKKQP
ncbi:MAG: Modulator of FtsH protease HflC [Holosporales bacterium]